MCGNKMYNKSKKIYIAIALIALSANIFGQGAVANITYGTYDNYLQKYAASSQPDNVIFVSTENIETEKSTDISLLTNYSDCSKAIKTSEKSKLKYKFTVEKAGLYSIAVRYIPIKGKDIPIERRILINESLPFADFNDMVFNRVWQYSKIETDANGNEFINEQNEKFKFTTEILHSGDGINDEYKVFLNQGINTIEFISLKEGMVIDFVKFFNHSDTLNYEDYIETLAKEGKTNKDVNKISIEAENAYEKSDISLYPLYDRTSPLTYPNDIVKVKLNTIGGQNWRNTKQSISWQVNVDKSGLYKLNLRFKQDYNEGSSSFRRLYIDQTIPFKEAAEIEFKFFQGWQILQLGGSKPYLFYLSKGTHILTLESVFGEASKSYEQIKSVVADLNDLYRKIIMITSLTPDPNRDYHISETIEGLESTLKKNEKILDEAKKSLFQISKSKGQDYSLIEKFQYQLMDFMLKPDTIPSRLNSFSTNISDLSIWSLSKSNQSLLLDYILFSSEAQSSPRADVSFIEKFIYDTKSFFLSFISDYDTIRPDSQTNKSVTLWLGGGTAGRDQANAIKTLVNNNFSRQHKISLNIRLIDLNAMLPAVASGSGPDVAVSQDRAMPLNYGFRGAVYDISQFKDCTDILKNFPKAAIEPFKYGKSVYGLPDTFVFPMMFYRKDILQDAKIEIPNTWDDLYTLLPKLGNKYLSLGLPSVTLGNNDIYYTFLYQNCGSLYNEKLDEAIMDNEKSIKAFQAWSYLYTKYSVPQTLDIFTRFRTGESPIVIAPYTFYNQLIAVAPEINGLWDMTLVPGTKTDDDKIDRTVSSTSTATVMFRNAKDKNSSWEFIKWWTSIDAQQKYNKELEILLGPSGRIPVACLNALDILPWSFDDISKLKDQLQYTRGIPEVPGGYMTQRYINTAILLAINNGISPRQAITNYNKLINDEMKTKIEEFGLR
jgi:ABC-type glycerol-3-phosphate transport system substrate-binding protein